MTRSTIFEYRDLLSKTRCGLFTVHSKKPSPPILIGTDSTQPLSKSSPECGQSIGGKGRSNLEKTTLIPCLVPRSINRSRLAIVLCYFSRYPPARCCRSITRSILQVYGGLSLSDAVPASTDRPALSPLSRRSVAAQKPSYSHRLDAPTDSNFGALLLRVSHLPAQQSLLPHKRYDSSLSQWNQGPRAGSIKGMPSGDAIIVFG